MNKILYLLLLFICVTKVAATEAQSNQSTTNSQTSAQDKKQTQPIGYGNEVKPVEKTQQMTENTDETSGQLSNDEKRTRRRPMPKEHYKWNNEPQKIDIPNANNSKDTISKVAQKLFGQQKQRNREEQQAPSLCKINKTDKEIIKDVEEDIAQTSTLSTETTSKKQSFFQQHKTGIAVTTAGTAIAVEWIAYAYYLCKQQNLDFTLKNVVSVLNIKDPIMLALVAITAAEIIGAGYLIAR